MNPFRVAVAALIVSASASAADVCRIVSGDFAAARTVDCPAGKICARGPLTGGLTGTYDFVFDSTTPIPGGISFTSHSTETLPSAATLTTADAGQIRVLGNLGYLLTNARISAGTAEMTGATGSILFSGRMDMTAVDMAGRYSGKLCTPAR